MQCIWQYLTYLAKQCRSVSYCLGSLPDSILFGFRMHRRCPKSTRGVWRDVPDMIIGSLIDLKWKWRSNRRCYHLSYIRLQKRLAETKKAIFAASRVGDSARRDQLWQTYRQMYRKYHF